MSVIFGRAIRPKTKTSHLKKMKYTKLIIPTGVIAINLEFYDPDTILSVQDTLQTSPRHLPYTRHVYRHPKICHVLTNLRQLGEKEKANLDESDLMVVNCLHITSPQTVSRVTQTTPRHLSDKLQPTFRQSEAPGREGTS